MSRLERDVMSISHRLNQEESKFNDFLLENSFATISTAIEPGVRLEQIDLASPGLKAKMLRYSKFALTYPDGSNPTIIELKVANLPLSATTINIWVSGSNAWEQDVFPAFGYPVGSLISGLDYEANSILAAAGDSTNTNEVQYNSGGFLASSGLTGAGSGGSNYDFTFDPATGVVTAEGFAGDGSALTNLPATSPSGSDQQVQFNDGGSFGADSTFKFNKYSNALSSGRYLGENVGAGLYTDQQGYMAMYLIPTDFIPSSSSTYNGYINSNGGKMGWGTTSYYSQFASFQVPAGYKVTDIYLTGSANYPFYVYANQWSSASSTYKATGYINTSLSLMNNYLTGSSGVYYTIKFNPSSYGNFIYGCRLLLYPI